MLPGVQPYFSPHVLAVGARERTAAAAVAVLQDSSKSHSGLEKGPGGGEGPRPGGAGGKCLVVTVLSLERKLAHGRVRHDPPLLIAPPAPVNEVVAAVLK